MAQADLHPDLAENIEAFKENYDPRTNRMIRDAVEKRVIDVKFEKVGLDLHDPKTAQAVLKTLELIDMGVGTITNDPRLVALSGDLATATLRAIDQMRHLLGGVIASHHGDGEFPKVQES